MSSTAATHPPGADGGAQAQRALRHGLTALRKRQFEPAERAFTKALALSPQDAAIWLLRAAARTRLGHAVQARDDILRACELRPQDAAIHSAAAGRLARLGLIEQAVSLLRAAIERATTADQLRLRVDLANICLRAGRSHQCIAELRRAAEQDSSLALTLAGWLRGFGDSEAALQALTDSEAKAAAPGEHASDNHVPASDETQRLAASLLCDLGRYEQARARIEPLSSGSPKQRNEDARLLVRCGAFEEAQRRVEEVTRPDAESSAQPAKTEPNAEPADAESSAQPAKMEPSAEPADADADAWLLRGELALWRGDHEEALHCAEQLSALNADEPARSRLRGAALLLAGREQEASQAIERTLQLSPGDPEALLWRGELLRAQGDLDASLRDIDAGITASHGYPLAGHLSRLITVTEAHQRAGVQSATMHPDAFHELLALLEPVLGKKEPRSHRLRSELLKELRGALKAMAGNRSTRPSYINAHGLQPLDVPMHTRFAARTIQELIRVRDIDEVVAQLSSLAANRGDEPTIHCHIGEIYLWLGDAERADAAFKRALRDTEQVRWAYIGLCATEMIRPDYEEALRWCDRGCQAFPPPGRTMYAYRGEVYRRLGDLKRAREDTCTMMDMTPGRISSWINLALIDHTRGHSAPLTTVLKRLKRRAPGLLDDAHRELSLDLFATPDADTIAQLFEHMLTMMRGNRSSSFVSYFTAQGELRFAPQP